MRVRAVGRRLRIGFVDFRTDYWSAGEVYLKNLFHALSSLGPERRPETVLISEAGARAGWEEGVVDRVVVLGGARKKKRSMWGRVAGRLLGRGAGPGPGEERLAAAVEESGVDCLFTINEVPRGQRVPVMTWIPDLQHVSLPEMFSAEEIRGRDRMFREAAERADRVILSSGDAQRQYEAFAPGVGVKSSVVSFTAHFEPSSFARSPEPVVAGLHLPGKYFFLPNQFWRHKNHELVIEAVRLAKEEEPGIVVVCSGNTNDYRHPRYYGTLLAAVSRAGVREQMVMVGLVERHEVHQLMRQALAVVQPSRFEGWSTTVEEAKAIGRPLLLSDLPVHREQVPEGAEFFGVDDAVGLAGLLVKAYRGWAPGPDVVAERAARMRSMAAAVVHGEAFLGAALKACGRAA